MLKVTLAGLTSGEPVKCSRNIILLPDESLDAALARAPYDAVVLPGGGSGAKALANHSKVIFRN